MIAPLLRSEHLNFGTVVAIRSDFGALRRSVSALLFPLPFAVK